MEQQPHRIGSRITQTHYQSWKGFHSLRTAKPKLQGVEAFRFIKPGHLLEPMNNSAAEVRLLNELFGIAAWINPLIQTI